MRDYLKFYIDGRWVEPSGSGTFDVVNPATEEVAGRIRVGDEADVNHAVQAARRAFKSFSQTTREERIALLERVQAEFQRRAADLAAAVTEEMGAPAWLAKDAHVPLPLGHISTAIEILKNYEFDRRQGISLIRKAPIGVCALITPWNWPVSTTITKVIPVLATGCTMVLKPAKFAPFSAYILVEIMDAAKVPAGVFNLVNGDGAKLGALLSAHPDVDMVSITGSTRAGVEVARNAAPTVKRVHQELGGKSPIVILEDADLEKAVPSAIRFLMLNSGQTCSAGSRLIAPKSRLAEVIAIAKATAEGITVGSPASGAFMGPVVNKAQWDDIQKFINSGIEQGATLVTGGPGRPSGLEKGYYLKPTIFADTAPGMEIVREEIFGPVMVIQSYDDVEDAIRIANDTVYGLAAYVHAGSLEKAREVGARIRAGQVYLNGDMDLVDLAAPFGGCKMSGNGREWGEGGFEACVEEVAFIGYAPPAAAG